MQILEAYQLAAHLHTGQVDKASRPYIEHLTRVFLRVLAGGGDLADNSDPQRLAELPEAVAHRLSQKYVQTMQFMRSN